ncbi:2-amino-4-hydroxy-6-hydroxymethyldihydropteridine diphosphokinase [Candidatus Peribacteria bacterium]|nr:2-amino-4-hydroxy-6-hydroxymethyldihydropteridine diphosphokinase [Candidatus Peribacteria bacterium]
MPSIFIALGSNIDPENNLKAAVTMLRDRHAGPIRFSSVYRSSPLHHEEQDDFLNAIAAFDAELNPEVVFDMMSHIESKLGKAPPFRFGPRTIDLDLLLHGSDTYSNPLIIPHPRMHERRFVLEPLTELLHPQEKHPTLGKTWGQLLKKTLDQKIERVRIVL